MHVNDPGSYVHSTGLELTISLKVGNVRIEGRGRVLGTLRYSGFYDEAVCTLCCQAIVTRTRDENKPLRSRRNNNTETLGLVLIKTNDRQTVDEHVAGFVQL